MHALLGALKIGQQGKGAAEHGVTWPGERVEHAHLDVGLKSQAHHLSIRARAVKIIEEHTNPDAFARSFL